MKFELKGPLRENIYNLMRKAGYHFLRKDEQKGELEFIRPAKGYPRFHLFIKSKEENLIFHLHLDQKRPIYQGTPAHAGEYQGELVSKEAERIKQILEIIRNKMKKLLIATTNPGKLREYNELLKGLPLKLISPKELKIKRKPNENGKTFKENAIKKAKFYSKLTNLPTLADDGGLEIEYLKGEPGVKSRRWPGYEATDQELIDFALKKLKGVSWRKRRAQFRVVLALAIPGKKVLTAEGKIRGIILTKPRGKIILGYPYRSIFYLPKYKKSFNELSFKEEIKIGHRQKAVKKLIPILKNL